MALPINIEDLLNKRKIEGNRIEFKKGWSQTGIPVIQDEMQKNGSPRATFETTEDRLTFLIHIPSHIGCSNKLIEMNGLEATTETTTETTTEKATEKTEKATEKTEKTTEKTTESTTEKIIRMIKKNPQITNKELAETCGITEDGVYWNTKKLKKNNIIRRVGGDRGGHWEVIGE